MKHHNSANSFQPKFGRRSSTARKSQLLTPSSNKYDSQSPTRYNTPSSSKYENILTENTQLAQQLANKASQYNALRLYIQNIEQDANQTIMKLTEQNKYLLKELQQNEDDYNHNLRKTLMNLEKLEQQHQQYRLEKQKQIRALRMLISRGSKDGQQSQPSYFYNPDFIEGQVDKLMNVFAVMNTPPQKLKYLNQIPIKQNTGVQYSKQSFNSSNTKKLQQLISVRDTDIRLLKQQIHNISSTFSEQMTKISNELSQCQNQKIRLQILVEQQRAKYESDLKKLQQQHKLYVQQWSNALLNINDKSMNGIKSDISNLQSQNICLSKQIEDKISKLLQRDLKNYNYVANQQKFEEDYQQLIEKQQQIKLLKYELKNKEQNMKQLIQKCHNLQKQLSKLLQNNQRIMTISRRRITTQQVNLPHFGYEDKLLNK